MVKMSVDIETYSSVDLKTQGAFRYADSPDFEILLISYSVDGEEIKTIDYLTKEGIEHENEFFNLLISSKAEKWAFNAAFEMVCLAKWFGIEIEFNQWRDTALLSKYFGYPHSLAGVTEVLFKDKPEFQKSSTGDALIRYFSKPCAPTKANGGRTRNLPEHAPDKWAEYVKYNRQDVVAEMAVAEKFSGLYFPPAEWAAWHLDQEINFRGVRVDVDFAKSAAGLVDKVNEELFQKAVEITGLSNPNSVQQLKAWLEEETGEEMDNLQKGTIKAKLPTMEDGIAKEVLQLRQDMSKTSLKKYRSLLDCVCSDERMHGILYFYGAHTGRWCLAEDSPVLVSRPDGKLTEIPIQDVTIEDLVFDGDNWVKHEGVVFSGEKGVLDYDGVVATPEHYVYISDTEKVQLAYAAAENLQIWRGIYTPRESIRKPGAYIGKRRTYDIINAGPKNRFMTNGRIVSNSGKLFQPQNLAKISMNHDDLVFARRSVKNEDYDALSLMYDSKVRVLSELVRTVIIPDEGYQLFNIDFTSIEAVLLGFLAEEDWVVDTYMKKQDLYSVQAARMFGGEPSQYPKGTKERDTGKVMMLACGYQGGENAVLKFIKPGSMTKDEILTGVKLYRDSNPSIVRFWKKVENAAKTAIKTKDLVTVNRYLSFSCDRSGKLFMKLPSKRSLVYPQCGIMPHPKFDGQDCIAFHTGGVKGAKGSAKWGVETTYGGKLVENYIQAVARDCLLVAMYRAKEAGYELLLTVHDELICQKKGGSVEDLMQKINRPIDWLPGLLLRAAGEPPADFYCK